MSEFSSSARTATASQLVLRYMNGLEGDPITYRIPSCAGDEIAVTQIFRVNGNGKRLGLRQESSATKNAHDVVARFQVSKSFLFEPLVDGVTIEPPASDKLPSSFYRHLEKVSIPLSDDQEHFLVCLRPGDTVNFDDHSFKVQFDVEPPSMAPEVPAMASGAGDANPGSMIIDTAAEAASTGAEVQVKSSDLQSEPSGEHDEEGGSRVGSDAETEDDDEDDLDTAPSTARTPYAFGDGTPATSNPTVGEVKETPGLARFLSRPSTKDDDQPFSTAIEPADEDEEIRVTSSAVAAAAVSDDSPLAKKTRDSQDALPAKPQPTKSQEPPSDAPSEELGTIFSSAAKPRATYSRQASRTPKQTASGNARNSGSAKRTATVVSMVTTTDEEVTGHEEDDNINVAGVSDEVEEHSEIPTTSEPLDEHAVAVRAAKGSLVPQRGTKRKQLPRAARPDEEEVDDIAPVARKRAKREPAATTGKAAVSGKLSRVTRNQPIEFEEEEEIAVAPSKSIKKPGTTAKVTPSPQVLVSQNITRATPDSSAASTAMSGKTLRLLFSHSLIPGNNKPAMAWLKKQRATDISDVPTKRSHFICVVPKGPLATTAKILRTLALGKLVVTDDWVTDSKEQGQLLEPDDYVHDSLEDTVHEDRSMLFKGKTVYFTTKLVQDYRHGWVDVQALVREIGASFVESGSAHKGERESRMSDMIFFGSADDDDFDKDVEQLIGEHKKIVYHKDMLTQSVLRGEVDFKSEEFRLKLPKSKGVAKKSSGGRKR